MQHILRCRSLWRASTLDTSFGYRPQVYGGSTARFASTWAQDAAEANRDSDGPPLSGRVHILGIGNVGSFIAHSLAARSSPPPITLCMHNKLLYNAYRQRKESIAVSVHGMDNIQKGFDVEVVDQNGAWFPAPSKHDRGPGGKVSPFFSPEEAGPIENLIVCTKAHHTVLAMEDIAHRLTPESTICFIHNGMGVIDILNQKVFPNPETRPNYIQGVFSHGLTRKEQFSIAHMGVGTTILSPVGHRVAHLTGPDAEKSWAPTTKYLMQLLTLTPALVATAETPAGLIQYQLEKLAVNCCINPITALGECNNGELLYSFSYTRVMRLLLFEISAVICALPELQGVPGIEDRFSAERLRRYVVSIARMTARNESSMLQDINNSRTTEIEYFNGYIVRRGEELGIKCALNYMMKHLITGKATALAQRDRAEVPFSHEGIVFDGEEPL
ncbi:hypothetical protein N7508_005563 [Penicillium antarcticum]|uniref:uncharacterized protein n=1 Tax=Penicillium antarcticum TaxID=416450 RepID=UPI002393BB3B|nr:uncharacterized protein N7508_005563 [Penicillium antarcticum]KAJ5306548.1 hypothetical protein N7508_005563 [Penicillium antarcticum]